jgi:protein-arginine kinase
MESIEESELPSDQQLFNCQLELERNLKSINNDLNANQNESQTIIYQYLDHILEHNLITIQDFGNGIHFLFIFDNSL